MDAETTDSPTEEQLGADSPAHATGALLSGAEDPEPESTGAAPVETACENAGKELDTEQNGAPFEKPKLASSGSQEETSGDAAASDARESTEPEDMPSGGESFSREEGEEANRDNVPPDVVAEVTDAGSIPLEAILSHLPEEGSLPFLEQRLQAGEQPAEGDAGIESTEASVPSQHVDPDNTSSASDGNTPATSAAAGLEEEAPDAAPKSVEEMLEEERTKRQLAEAQVEALTLKLQEAEAATTHALEQVRVSRPTGLASAVSGPSRGRCCASLIIIMLEEHEFQRGSGISQDADFSNSCLWQSSHAGPPLRKQSFSTFSKLFNSQKLE